MCKSCEFIHKDQIFLLHAGQNLKTHIAKYYNRSRILYGNTFQTSNNNEKYRKLATHLQDFIDPNFQEDFP